MKKTMKKQGITIIKRINTLLNEQPTPEEEADFMLKYILSKNTTDRSIEIFEVLEQKFQAEMQKREKQAAYICRLVSNKYQKQQKTSIAKDLIFEQPIKE